jgi:serine/threonine protein kinase
MNPSKYDIIKQIGGGQEGKIFLAEQGNSLYAIKELIGEPNEGEQKLLSSIEHPGVIRFHEVIMKDSLCLVLEYASEGIQLAK